MTFFELSLLFVPRVISIKIGSGKKKSEEEREREWLKCFCVKLSSEEFTACLFRRYRSHEIL